MPMHDENTRLAIHHDYFCYTDTHLTLMDDNQQIKRIRNKEILKKIE